MHGQELENFQCLDKTMPRLVDATRQKKHGTILAYTCMSQKSNSLCLYAGKMTLQFFFLSTNQYYPRPLGSQRAKLLRTKLSEELMCKVSVNFNYGGTVCSRMIIKE
jgi:hypothetical protein